jgi:hypothetical protein
MDGRMSTLADWENLYWKMIEAQQHREMTAADLGLREPVPFQEYLRRANALYRNMPISDAPYAFWLGAEG